MNVGLCSNTKRCKNHLKPGRQIHCWCKQLTSVTFSLFIQAANLVCVYILLNASVRQCRANNIWLHLTLDRSTICTQNFFLYPASLNFPPVQALMYLCNSCKTHFMPSSNLQAQHQAFQSIASYSYSIFLAAFQNIIPQSCRLSQ